MAIPNLLSLTTVNAKTAVLAITTSATAIVQNTASSGKSLRINTLFIANIDGTNGCDLTVDIYRSSTAYRIVSTITIPADATLVPITKDAMLTLEEGDSLRLTASADSDLVGVCSYEDLS